MKKIIFTAALLGSAYFAQAQIAVGTPTPINSAYLDITASDKGILIPRVKLTSTTVFAPITGDQEESLLIYNTATAGTGTTAVKPGFYYWKNEVTGVPAHWERVTDEAHLTEVIETMVEANLDNIKELLEVAYPSNNIEGTPTGGPALGGGMVYVPGTPSDPASISYVYYDGTNYVRKEITDDIADFIKGTESKTFIVSSTGDKKYQYYISETYLIANNNISPDQAIVNNWADGTNPIPAGVYLIDVVGGVVNNFQDILNENITVGGETITIEEYIQYISSQAEGTMTFVPGTTDKDGDGGVSTEEMLGSSSFTYVDASGTTQTITFGDLIKSNETVTTLTKGGTTGAVGDEIKYTYVSEDDTTTVITLTADVLNSITNNETIKNAITNIMNAGGNVYYGKIDDTATEDVFYTIEANGDKTPIDISSTVVNAITNLTDEQTNVVKNKLGDEITNNTSVFTGDTYVDGSDTYYVYKGEFTTTITANSALTSGVTLDKAGHKVLSIDIDYGKGLVSSVTDITLAGAALGFNIGVGNTYTVLGTANITAKVIVTFASAVEPEGL